MILTLEKSDVPDNDTEFKYLHLINSGKSF